MFSDIEIRLRDKGYYAIATVARAYYAKKQGNATRLQSDLFDYGHVYFSESGFNAALDLNMDLSGVNDLYKIKIRTANERERPSDILYIAKRYAFLNPAGCPEDLLARVKAIRDHNTGDWHEWASKTYDYCIKRKSQ